MAEWVNDQCPATMRYTPIYRHEVAMAREPYLVTVIRQIADLEAMENPAPDETGRLNQYRRWLGEHYPDVSAALAREYLAMGSRRA